MTRREMIGMLGVGAASIAIAGRYALSRQGIDQPEGHFVVHHTDAEWHTLLSPVAYNVLRQGGTEVPFSSALLAEHRPGIFSCAGCDKLLFDSRTKFDSRTGWPSFWDVIPGAVTRRKDRSLATNRTEVRCGQCGSHLGHVFDDGPKLTGLRYCMNGVALKFRPQAS